MSIMLFDYWQDRWTVLLLILGIDVGLAIANRVTLGPTFGRTHRTIVSLLGIFLVIQILNLWLFLLELQARPVIERIEYPLRSACILGRQLVIKLSMPSMSIEHIQFGGDLFLFTFQVFIAFLLGYNIYRTRLVPNIKERLLKICLFLLYTIWILNTCLGTYQLLNPNTVVQIGSLPVLQGGVINHDPTPPDRPTLISCYSTVIKP